jgi:hypothetical protein
MTEDEMPHDFPGLTGGNGGHPELCYIQHRGNANEAGAAASRRGRLLGGRVPQHGSDLGTLK